MTAQVPDVGTVAALLGDAAAAPSLHNTQPWRFRWARGSRVLQLYAEHGRALTHLDPDGRALHLSCGAALFNLRVAAAGRGWRPETRLLPETADPALLATVRLEEPAESTDPLSSLHPAIAQRHTSRYPFWSTDIPATLMASLRSAAGLEGATLSPLSGPGLHQVLELTREAETRNAADPGRLADLTRWTRIGASLADTASDGVPEYALGPRDHEGSAAVRDFAGGQPLADRGTTQFEPSPALALLSTAGDGPADWLRAGQAVERVLLAATLEELVSSFLTQAAEWPDMRPALADAVPGTGHVQTVLRLGYGPRGPRTPRRAVHEILELGT